LQQHNFQKTYASCKNMVTTKIIECTKWD
jgi:hypothetical protein